MRHAQALGGLCAAVVGIAALGCGSSTQGSDPSSPLAGKFDTATDEIDTGAIDWSISPCDDFYQFACGKWIEEVPVPGPHDPLPFTSRALTPIVQEEMTLAQQISDEIEQGRLDDADSQRATRFYQSCMAETPERFRTDLLAQLQTIDALAAITPTTIAQLAAQLAANEGGSFFFAMIPEDDPNDRQNPVRAALHSVLYQSFDPSRITDVFGLLGMDAATTQQQTDAVVRFVKALEQGARTSPGSGQSSFLPASRADLIRLTPHFDWNTYLAGIGFPSMDAFDLTNAAYWPALDSALATAALPDLKAFLRFLVVAGYQSLWDHVLDPSLDAPQDQAAIFPRDKRCFTEMAYYLSNVISRQFVLRTSGPEERSLVSMLVSDIVGSFDHMLANEQWLDEPTRMQARNKLAHLAPLLDYPESLLQGELYPGLMLEPTNLLGNEARAKAARQHTRLSLVGQPTNRTDWPQDPFDPIRPEILNAFYNPAGNQIIVPAGILEAPFFSTQALRVLNYGTIGAVIGHEITHGFDNNGRHYDANGFQSDWWTPAADAAFTQRSQCLVDQYSQYAIDYMKKNPDGTTSPASGHVDGQQTLGENIADNGGVKVSFRAAGEHGKFKKGIAGFSPEQAYFVSFAQLWCEKWRPDALEGALRDVHAPAQFRVNGVLVNEPAFANAFQCAPTSSMVNANRCEVW